jgi:hypothetical protein
MAHSLRLFNVADPSVAPISHDLSRPLIWVSENRWHEELTVNGFKRIRDGAEGGYRQVSEVAPT